jgi:hypothetical protein
MTDVVEEVLYKARNVSSEMELKLVELMVRHVFSEKDARRVIYDMTELWKLRKAADV